MIYQNMQAHLDNTTQTKNKINAVWCLNISQILSCFPDNPSLLWGLKGSPDCSSSWSATRSLDVIPNIFVCSNVISHRAERNKNGFLFSRLSTYWPGDAAWSKPTYLNLEHRESTCINSDTAIQLKFRIPACGPKTVVSWMSQIQMTW